MKKLPGILVLLAGLCLSLPVAAQVVWTDFYGTVTYNGQPAPIGTVVDAFDPDGVHCGTFTVGDITDSAGIFGFMPVYGDDPFTAGVDEGADDGETISFKVNGRDATVDSGDPTWEEGQTIKVKVLEIQNLGMGRSERISLSIKALATDPWPETAGSMVPGQDVTGRVTRLVDFGVFVELQPGVEGLIHISELANRRVIHPREVLNEDEEINVRILDVDLDRRRISLSRKQAADYEED